MNSRASWWRPAIHLPGKCVNSISYFAIKVYTFPPLQYLRDCVNNSSPPAQTAPYNIKLQRFFQQQAAAFADPANLESPDRKSNCLKSGQKKAASETAGRRDETRCGCKAVITTESFSRRLHHARRSGEPDSRNERYLPRRQFRIVTALTAAIR